MSPTRIHPIMRIAAPGALLLVLVGCSPAGPAVDAAGPAGETPSLSASPTPDPTNSADPSADATGAAFTTVSDSTGVLSVSVPTGWIDSSEEQLEQNGSPYYRLQVSPDLALAAGGWSTPRIDLVASQDPAFDIDLAIQGSLLGIKLECDTNESSQYDDGRYVGTSLLGTGCGASSGGDLLSVVAKDSEGTTIFCTIQMVSDDDKTVVRDEILNTMRATF